jgi:hypothetical protein
VRISLAAACILPLGLTLGLFFPAALRLTERLERQDGIPLLWAINGSASVLGAALSMTLAREFSFTLALNAGSLLHRRGMLLTRVTVTQCASVSIAS